MVWEWLFKLILVFRIVASILGLLFESGLFGLVLFLKKVGFSSVLDSSPIDLFNCGLFWYCCFVLFVKKYV